MGIDLGTDLSCGVDRFDIDRSFRAVAMLRIVYLEYSRYEKQCNAAPQIQTVILDRTRFLGNT